MHGAVLLYDAHVELYVSVAVTAIVSAIIGLALSTLGRSLRGVPAAGRAGDPGVAVVRRRADHAGGHVGLRPDLLVRPGPMGLRGVGRPRSICAGSTRWPPTRRCGPTMSGWWMFDMVMLSAFGAMWAGFARYRLQRHQPRYT